MSTAVAVSSWVTGDSLGLEMPAHPAALREGGAAFLTRAFRAAGVLGQDNRVVRITQCQECPGGSTGRKLLLAVAYERPQPGLHEALFAKFSRDFEDPVRDQGRTQMELEVRFALLARQPGFPVATAACHFADYHEPSGTGLLITQRIAFGRDGIERHYDKCLDEDLPEPLAHYQALLRTLARLAGTHRAGRLPVGVSEQFPFDPSKLTVGQRAPYSAEQLQRRAIQVAGFAAAYPGLLPENIRSVEFLARLEREVGALAAAGEAIRAELRQREDYIALCHWNANVDNAWFWRGDSGGLECGLLDWGCVSQMNVAMAIWGAMSAAQHELWDRHGDELLALFVAEYRAAGGPQIDVVRLKRQVLLYAALMGGAWLLDAPRYLQVLVPELEQVRERSDPRLRGNEMARSQLQMLINFLNLWQTQDVGGLLAAV